MSQYAALIERLRELLEKATPGPYRAHDHRGMARVGADPADWIGYAWVGRITENSGPNGAFDARWLDADRRKDACKEYRERAEHDVALVAEALNALPVLLDAIASLEAALTEVKRLWAKFPHTVTIEEEKLLCDQMEAALHPGEKP